MARPSNYSPELRARAVRMVAELTPDYPSQYAAITAVAKKLGIGKSLHASRGTPPVRASVDCLRCLAGPRRRCGVTGLKAAVGRGAVAAASEQPGRRRLDPA